MDLDKIRKEQDILSGKLILTDGFSDLMTIAGCDIAYAGDRIISAIVVMDYKTLKVRESCYTIGKVRFPYIPGFLSYREAPITVESYHRLELDPDVLMIDGNGILHPRKIGLASHFGLLIDKPTIGVAKSLLCGEERDSSVYMGKDFIGRALSTKVKARPIYVSQGHKISIKSALEIVKHTLRDHKLPEPLHEAHKLANKIKRRIRDDQSIYQ